MLIFLELLRQTVGRHPCSVVPLSPCAALNLAETVRQNCRRYVVRPALIKDCTNVSEQSNADGGIFGSVAVLANHLQCLCESFGPSAPSKLRDGEQDFGNVVLTRIETGDWSRMN